jgi:hypothetical protein
VRGQKDLKYLILCSCFPRYCASQRLLPFPKGKRKMEGGGERRRRQRSATTKEEEGILVVFTKRQSQNSKRLPKVCCSGSFRKESPPTPTQGMAQPVCQASATPGRPAAQGLPRRIYPRAVAPADRAITAMRHPIPRPQPLRKQLHTLRCATTRQALVSNGLPPHVETQEPRTASAPASASATAFALPDDPLPRPSTSLVVIVG